VGGWEKIQKQKPGGKKKLIKIRRKKAWEGGEEKIKL
jgi:hypothetical protein